MDMSAHNKPALQHQHILENYVAVCNEAMQANKDRFPFKQILGAAQRKERNQPVEVVLSDVHPPEIYVFRLQESGLGVQPHDTCENCDCIRSWKTQLSYLRNVAQNPGEYIDNPAKLDWDWIYDV